MNTRLLKNTAQCIAATFVCLLMAGSSLAQMATPHQVVEVQESVTDPGINPLPEAVVSVYPNPSVTGVFYVETEEPDVQLQVFSQAMNPVNAQIAYSERDGAHKIEMSRVDDGMYFLFVTTAKGRSVIQLMKR